MIVDRRKVLEHRSYMERGESAEDRHGSRSEHGGYGCRRQGGVQRRGERNAIAELMVQQRKAPEKTEANQLRARRVASTPSAMRAGA